MSDDGSSASYPFPFAAYKYQPGGSLPVDAPSYVVRQADAELYQALLVGEYCYVLNARQMGKSSLRIQTMNRLRSQGIACAEIELTGIGSQQITATQWYGGIIQELISGFELQVNRRTWLQAHDDLSPVQRLSHFIETVLLAQIHTPLVIFIDEIDSVLGLSFLTDDFFALIRNCYEKRAAHPAYQRLTFALLGVATPSDLMRDKHATPFNIGRAIELRGFQLDESYALVKGLESKADNPLMVLKQILDWTGGQPFLTQKLCWMVTSALAYIPAGKEPESIEQLVRSRLIDNWETQDEPEHLRTIRDRLLRHSQSRRLLKLYRQILRQGKLRARNTPEYLELRLSGLVVKQAGYLVVFNRIYQTVFDQRWIRQELGMAESAAPILPIWSVLAAGLLIAAGLIGLRSLGMLERWELAAFDQLLRLRPEEGPDQRLLLVTITEQDVQSQPAAERGVASLSDRMLNQLLAKLEAAKPRAIGLDIYRNYPVNPNLPQLAQRMQRSDRLVAICYFGNPGVYPPPEVQPHAQGFNNVLLDSDRVVRRHLLAVGDASPCQNKFSFNMQIGVRYLKQEQFTLQYTPDDYIQIGDVVFRTITANTGGYHQINHSGHQVILNYRATRQIAQTVSLQQVLHDQVDLATIRDRIVLIGTTDPSFNDTHWITPYSAHQRTVQTMAGVEVQAHMVSQILSAVLDQRPLIWTLSQSAEQGWILFWAWIGGLLACWLRTLPRWLLASGMAIAILYGGCLAILTMEGGWLPFVPGAIAFLLAGNFVILIPWLQPGRL
ncbi:CHASE2 domain-containing protein [Leptothermofonsia sp. ETS-13]|uniref:CHASE2 domain-containing protein n=1 Tax=Leptothermofonsia sp. ETS-13 TaxID=3035696 RepID=UPI003B9F8DB5